WQPGRALRARIDAVTGALPTAWRTATRYGTAVPGADDALALWALTCIESRAGGSEDDELEVPDALRAAVVAEPAPRDDEAVAGRGAGLDPAIPPLVSRPPDRTLTQRIDRVLLHRAVGFAAFIAVMSVLFMSLFWWAQPVIDAIDELFKWCG